MAVELSVHAKEQSTYVVTASFYDEDGNLVVPDTIKWTLSNLGGMIINSREDVIIAVPVSQVEIVLSGDDLAIFGSDISSTPKRLITVEATYTSALGANLPLNGSATFVLDAMIMVP